MSATASRGIRDSAAWKLIDSLRKSSRCFSRRATSTAASTGSTHLHQLRTAVSHLDVHIRTTFTVLQLELLLHLQEELQDDASQSSVESDSESEDDASSVSSAASEEGAGLAPAQHHTHIASSPNNPSSSQALSLLQGLCSLLEARVNDALFLDQYSHPNKASSYPRLERLVQHVLPKCAEQLELIPTPGSAPRPFLFNISEVAETAAAFDLLRDPAQKRPRRETRQRMLSDVELMRSRFLEFNSFVSNLQTSLGSFDTLAERRSESLACPRSFASFATLQKFQRQASAAFRAVFSQFGLCPKRVQLTENTNEHKEEHRIFLQLPEWEDVSDFHSADANSDLPVQLFINCPCSDLRRPASAYFLRSEHVDVCRKQRLCKALSTADDLDSILEFYVSEHASTPGEIPVHIREDRTSWRRHDDSFRFPAESFWTLVKDDYFARKPTMESLLRAGSNAAVFGIEQRKSLAVKLVLGLMLSLDSDHIIGTWNPKSVQCVKPHDEKFAVFISMNENKDTSGSKGLSLAKWDLSRDRGADDDDLQPLPPFTMLAKALLQIAQGERLKDLKAACHSEKAFRGGWKKHRKLVENYMQIVTSGDVVDREVLPFLHAALNCLDFHMLYQKRAKTAASSPRTEIAWKLVFTDILCRIDSSLTLERLVQPDTSDLVDGDTLPVTENPAQIDSVTRREGYPVRSDGTITAQPEVALFDGEDVVEGSIDIKRASVFFELLDDFHESYSRFVAGRVIESDVESPRRIRIAILDTGIDFGHPGIREAKEEGRVKEEWCHSWVGAENDINDYDDGLHGTNCAYILHKTAPEADIYVEKVFEGTSFRSYQAQNIAKAIDHAVETWDVDIISMSFGLRPPRPLPESTPAEERKAQQEFEDLVDDIQDAIRNASTRAPRIMFAAASNNGKNERRAFPARYDPWVICVHASDGKGNDGGINPPTESGTNFMTLGVGLELLERRWVVAGRTRRATYKKVYKSGTSFATPIAAGMSATVLDLAARVSAIQDRTRKKMRRCEEMRKVLRLMSTPKHDFGDQYSFLAPWNHWEASWQANEAKCRMAWDSINLLFAA